MVMSLSEFELEDEYEGEWEGEWESEEFFRRLAGLAQRAAQSPVLRQAALGGARAALRGLGNVGGAVGAAAAGGQGAALGRRLGAGLGSTLSGMLPQREFEFEYEDEFEGEWEDEYRRGPNPMRRVYPDALMEHLAHAATTARSEAEAEAFIGALVPLAARLIPRAAAALTRATPQLVRGAAAVTRSLRRNPTTRPLVRTMPTIMQRTAASLARQGAQRGRPPTPQTAVRTLARQTAQVIGSPQQAVQAYQRSRALDQRYHAAAGGRPPAGVPMRQFPPGRIGPVPAAATMGRPGMVR